MTMMQMLLMATSSLTSLPDAYLDLDFSSNSYRLADAASSFDAAFTGSSPKLTYATTSNSTMVNSSGNIVWAPHNLMPYSADFSNAAWTKTNASITTQAQAPDGTTTAWEFSPSSGLTDPGSSSVAVRTFDAVSSKAGDKLTWSVFVKPVVTKSLYVGNPDGADVEKDVFIALNADKSSGTSYWNADTASWATVDADHEEFSNSVGNGWYHIGITYTVSADDVSNNHFVYMANRSSSASFDPYPSGSEMVHIWGAHVYRSDLGGMAPVPGAATGLEYYVPTNGAVEYLPRVGHHVYNGSTWVNEGLLLESEARTNLLTNSADFSSWGTGAVGSLAVGGQAPDGTASATTVEDGGGGGSANTSLNLSATLTANTTYTFSVYAKSGTLDFVSLSNLSYTTGTGTSWFDLATPEVALENANHTATIEDVGNQWYRCSITFSTTTDTTGNVWLTFNDSASFSTPQNGASVAHIWGVQLEVGDTPSSYMPSNATTQGFRDAQKLDVPPAEFGWNSAGMSFAMEGRMTYTDNGTGVSVNGGDQQFYLMSANSTNYIMYGLSTTGSRTGQPIAPQRSSTQGAVSGALISSTGGNQDYAPGVLVPYTVSARHSTAGVQGANEGTANSFTATPTDRVTFSDLSSESMEFGVKYMGTIRHFRQWDEDIGETGIEEASS